MLARRVSLTAAMTCAAVGAVAASAFPASASAVSASATRAAAAPAYSVPSGSWSQFTSDLSSAAGLATGRGVTVAVLADGVDASVAGLGGKVKAGPRYIYKPKASLTHSMATLSVSIIVGATHVAQGVAPAARILSERVLPTPGEPGENQFYSNVTYDSTEQAILGKAIRYAVDHGAKVIESFAAVTSFAGASDSALFSAVNYALRKNVVIVSPEWGEGTKTYAYRFPGGIPGVISVASVMLPGGLSPSAIGTGPSGQALTASQSVRNNSVLLAGPGDFVPASATGWGLYGVATAGAYVTGTVALIKQRYPDLSPAMVERALATSARHKPAGGYSTQVGFGILNPYDAILQAGKLAKVTVTAGPGDSVVAAGSHFGTGPVPGTVSALPSAKYQLIASWSGVGAGAALLVSGLVLAVRRRRRPPRATAAAVTAIPPPGFLPNAR